MTLVTKAPTISQDGLLNVTVGSAQVVEPKDLIYVDAGVAYRASDQADQLSQDANAKLFARRFVGVSEHRKAAAETFRTISVNESYDAEHEFDCASETHARGEWMAVCEAASGTALENQKLIKTTDRSAAIFEVARDDAVASTTVRVKRLRQDLDRRLQSSIETLTGTRTLTKTSPRLLVLDPGGANRKVLLPPEADSAGVFVLIANAADAAEDLQIKDDSDTTLICTISQDERGIAFCDGTTWYGHTGAKT